MSSRRSVARTRSWRRSFLFGLLRTATISAETFLRNYLRTVEDSSDASRNYQRTVEDSSDVSRTVGQWSFRQRPTDLAFDSESTRSHHDTSTISSYNQRSAAVQSGLNSPIWELRQYANLPSLRNDHNSQVHSSASDLDDFPDFFRVIQRSLMDPYISNDDLGDPSLNNYRFENTSRESVLQENSVDEFTPKKHLWPCVVCAEKPPETMFSPCSHAVCCQECGDEFRQGGYCPVCSKAVLEVDKIYFTQDTCVVCMDSPPEAVFKPCYHAVCCNDCTATLLNQDELIDVDNKCPICKAYIDEADIFLLAYS